MSQDQHTRPGRQHTPNRIREALGISNGDNNGTPGAHDYPRGGSNVNVSLPSLHITFVIAPAPTAGLSTSRRPRTPFRRWIAVAGTCGCLLCLLSLLAWGAATAYGLLWLR